MTLSLGFNGASTVTNLQNCHDLAPNYAATLYGIMNTAGTTAGFITPLVVAYFTQDQVGFSKKKKNSHQILVSITHFQNTVAEWNIIFVIGSIAYIVPAILFIIFGSGNIQKWNEIPTTTSSKNKDDEKVEKQEDSTDIRT